MLQSRQRCGRSRLGEPESAGDSAVNRSKLASCFGSWRTRVDVARRCSAGELKIKESDLFGHRLAVWDFSRSEARSKSLKSVRFPATRLAEIPQRACHHASRYS